VVERRVILRPGPAFDVPETSGPDDGAVLRAQNREGDRRSGVLPSESGFDVTRGVGLGLRYGAPLVDGGVFGGAGIGGEDQSVDVAQRERFEADVRS